MRVLQWATEPTYDYHPPLPLPDSEAPERSLGDCSICMDAILLDAGPQKSMSEKSAASGQFGAGEGSAGGGGLLNAMHMGVGAKAARKNYSLAPCHHLFVSKPMFLSRKLLNGGVNAAYGVPGAVVGREGSWLLVPLAFCALTDMCRIYVLNVDALFLRFNFHPLIVGPIRAIGTKSHPYVCIHHSFASRVQ